MTKQEFIQEAALRLITATDVRYSVLEEKAKMARILADEVWNQFDDEQEEEPTSSFENDSVQVVAKEIARLEAEDVELENDKLGSKVHHKAGLDIRFLTVCRAQYSSYESCISTVKELVDCGRVAFARRKNMGPLTLRYVDKALYNLFGITSW